VHFVGYLDPGRYVGVDANSRLVSAGRDVELLRAGLQDKDALLVESSTFDFASIGRSFDFALAQSVFTHVPLNSIRACLVQIVAVLRPGARFFATFFEDESERGDLGPIHHPDGFGSHFDRDPYHYQLAALEWATSGTGLQLEYIGEWGHPRGQRMLAFSRPESPSGASTAPTEQSRPESPARSLRERVVSFPRWHYEIDLGDVRTPIFDPAVAVRHRERKRYFFDPLIEWCGGTLAGKRVLDLDSNAGFWSRCAAEAACDFVLGIDGRPLHVEQAKLVFETKGLEPER
jgi:SAM-dependent methyltransferase